MTEDYDIAGAIKRIEDELIASMIRNLDRHRAEENEIGINWEQWQVKQLAALEDYKKQNLKKYKGVFGDIRSRIESIIRIQREAGNAEQEISILQAIKEGAKLHKAAAGVTGEFFRMNDRKINALIKATTDDMQRAEYAMLRMSNDKYRQVIYNAQVYAASGAGTYEKAVDMATKDFLRAGINCVEYKNGARHTLSDYADMAIRTASKRAYLTGEGEKRKEWGISTVIMNKRGNPCPKCLPFVGKVLIDDVWSGGSSKDGKYPLMSSAIAAGLYHPRCKDGHTTYFPGISEKPDDKFTRKELDDIEEQSSLESKQQYAERQADSFDRLAKYSLDDENRRIYSERAKEWNLKASKRFTGYEELEKYIQSEYNGKVDNDIKTLNIRQVSQTLTEFEKVLGDFPNAKKFFTGINVSDRGKAAFLPNGELVLSSKYYKEATIKLLGIGFHEAGHLLELAVIYKNNPLLSSEEIYELYRSGQYAEQIVNDAFVRISTHKTMDELRKDISNYATISNSETIGDAVKDYYMNGYNASILSRQIIKVMREAI